MWSIGFAFLPYLKMWPSSHVLSKWGNIQEKISNMERLLKCNISKNNNNKYYIKHFQRTGHVPWSRDAHFSLKFWIECLAPKNDMPLHFILWRFPKDKFRDMTFSLITDVNAKINPSRENTSCYSPVLIWLPRWEQFRLWWWSNN